MKIGIVGLGNIAIKAFVPNYIMMHDQVDWVLFSRDSFKVQESLLKYGFKEGYSDFELFLNSGLDAVMIHTPTSTHFTLIKACLERGIHVYTDKPISEDIEEVYELYHLAEAKNLILFAGFNRRFAPMYRNLKAIPDKTMIIVQKNRASTTQETKYALFDMMSHVVDTALFLSDEAIEGYSIQTHTEESILHHATITFKTATTTIIAIMNMMSGGHTERVEVMSKSGHYVVNNMENIIAHTPKGKTLESFNDWTPTVEKRGFKDMILAFIESIETLTNNDSSPESVMQTHLILTNIYENTL